MAVERDDARQEDRDAFRREIDELIEAERAVLVELDE